MVNESTIDGFVPENALAGPIPTEIGQLVQLEKLYLGCNQLTGACLQIIELIDGKRVYHQHSSAFLFISLTDHDINHRFSSRRCLLCGDSTTCREHPD